MPLLPTTYRGRLTFAAALCATLAVVIAVVNHTLLRDVVLFALLAAAFVAARLLVSWAERGRR